MRMSLSSPCGAREGASRLVRYGRAWALALSLVGIGVGASVAEAGSAAATNDYPHWLVAEWQWRLALPVTASKKGVCITRSQHGPIWFLASSDEGSVVSDTCAIPAGRSVMLDVPSVECSTVERPRFHAPTDAFLERCAKRHWQRYSGGLKLTIDGRALKPAGYIIETGAFPFTQPARDNLTNTPGRTRGRAAVYGAASILTPLSRGTHVLVLLVGYDRTSISERVTYHLTVG